jgi:hypothetical protein
MYWTILEATPMANPAGESENEPLRLDFDRGYLPWVDPKSNRATHPIDRLSSKDSIICRRSGRASEGA